MAKCKYWIGPYKECKLINTHKPCPSNVDLTSCNIIPKKPKTKSVAGYVALNKAGIAYAFKPAQSDYWLDKKVWTEAVISYRVKGCK